MLNEQEKTILEINEILCSAELSCIGAKRLLCRLTSDGVQAVKLSASSDRERIMQSVTELNAYVQLALDAIDTDVFWTGFKEGLASLDFSYQAAKSRDDLRKGKFINVDVPFDKLTAFEPHEWARKIINEVLTAKGTGIRSGLYRIFAWISWETRKLAWKVSAKSF